MNGNKIALMGEKVLQIRSKEVDVDNIVSGKYNKFISDLTRIMIEEDGVGLSAPQIFLPERIFVININYKDRKTPKSKIFFNPKIKPIGDKISKKLEGCLSTPGVFGYVERYHKIRIDYCNEHGVKCREIYSGELATFIQHENDHLEGILWIDRCESSHEMYYSETLK